MANQLKGWASQNLMLCGVVWSFAVHEEFGRPDGHKFKERRKRIIKYSVPCPDCIPQDYIHICPLISKSFVNTVDLARTYLLLNLT